MDLHNVALGNKSESLTLHVLGGGSIMAAIAIDQELDTAVRESYEISVVRGDDVLPTDINGRVFLKIDVEGFELFVLQGMSQAINRWKPAILLEVERRYLERAGTSVEELFAFLRDRGYSAYDVSAAYERKSGHRLLLKPVPDIGAYNLIEGTPDLLWLPHGDLRISPREFLN